MNSARRDLCGGYRFYPSGITKAQVDAAQNDAVNKRNAASSLASQATAAEQASLQASAAYNAAETRRQAAQVALASAEQAAAAAEKNDRLMQQRKPLRRPEPLPKKQKRCWPVVQPQIN